VEGSEVLPLPRAFSSAGERMVETWSDRPDLTMFQGLAKIGYRLATSGFA